MRKIDEVKPITGKAAQTINFDKVVLTRLLEKAKKEDTTISRLVNRFCRQIIMTDKEYYRQVAKYHYIKFQENKYMEDQCGD